MPAPSPRTLIAALLLLVFATPSKASGLDFGRVTGLPVPRFVSTKSSATNVRAGPGVDYPLKWRFVHRGLPLEVIDEFGNWRRIRDWSGSDGWVFAPLLAGKRTGLVASQRNGQRVPLRSASTRKAEVVALLEPRVRLTLNGCDGRWCDARIGSVEGYVRQTKIWGAYPGEQF